MFPSQCFFIVWITLSVASSIRVETHSHHPIHIDRRNFSVDSSNQDRNSDVYYLAGFKSNQDGLQDVSKVGNNKSKQIKDEKNQQNGESQGQDSEFHVKRQHEDADEFKSKKAEGGKFSEKKGHKKGHKTKGWHNMFFRDEYHKEHRFYDDAHKSGKFDKHGTGQSSFKHGSEGQKKGGRYQSKYNIADHGRKGHKKVGHNVQELKGGNSKQGDESHHSHRQNYGIKGMREIGQHFGFAHGTKSKFNRM